MFTCNDANRVLGYNLRRVTIYSIGHDLWKIYNLICLLWMIINSLYSPLLLTHLHTGFLLANSVFLQIQPTVAMGKNNSMTLHVDASMWNN